MGVGRKKKEHFNDLLLPVIFTLCVLPFTVYLAEYDYGYSKYLWHSDNSVMQDFYAYYRSYFFLIIVFFAVIILLFRVSLYRNEFKRGKVFLTLAGYSVFVILSTVFSVNKSASLRGNYVVFEGVFVLLGYGIMGYYTYQMMQKERDYQSILHAVMVMFVPMSVIGWFQVFKHDLLNYEWMQKIVMSDELFQEYGGSVEDLFSGNNVFLSLDNPNFAAVFLLMFACVFAVQAVTAEKKSDKLVAGIFLVDVLVLCWFTYTRAVFAALGVAGLTAFFCRKRKWNKKSYLWIFFGVGLLFVLFIMDETLLEGKFMTRIFDEKKETKLEEIQTTERGVEIYYGGGLYTLAMQDGGGLIVYDKNNELIRLDYSTTGDYLLPFLGNARADVIEWDGERQILLLLEDYTLQFVEYEGSYYYETDWGKLDKMAEIERVDFKGLEYLGSGRLYIWSRVLPMLKNYLLTGSGPDTFAEVYPQNDYAGKMIYAENTGRIIERAHNDYLMRWVQTGMVSVIFLLMFYVVFVKKCIVFFRKSNLTCAKERLGYGCFLGCVSYMVCSFFSDSTLYTTPVFYVFAGIALAAAVPKPGQ